MIKKYIYGMIFLLLVSSVIALDHTYIIPTTKKYVNSSFENVSYYNSTYWNLTGDDISNTNTGNVNLNGDLYMPDNDIIANNIKAYQSGFESYAKIISRPVMFYGLGYNNEEFTIDNYGSIFNPDGLIETGRSITAGLDITAGNDIYADNNMYANIMVAGDLAGSYYWAEGGYSEVYGFDGTNTVTDFWNNNGGDVAFGLRYTDNMFMIGTDFLVTDETGLNMNTNKEFGLGVLPTVGYKLVVNGTIANPSTNADDFIFTNLYESATEGFKFKGYDGLALYPDLLDLSFLGGADFNNLKITTTGLATLGNGIINGNLNMTDGDITNIDELYFDGTDIVLRPMTTTLSKISIGHTTATHDYQTNIGYSNTGIDRSVLVGFLINSAGNYAVNLGYDADSGATKTVAIGYGSDATEESNVALGDTAQATGSNNAIAIGTAIASANKAISIGELSQSTQTSSVAVGYGAQATGGYGCVAIGPNTKANGGSSFAMGYLAEASSYGMGLGASSKSTTSFANALGYKSIASGISSLAIGSGATTAGQDGPTASGRNSIAIGGYNAVTTSDGAIASGVGSICIGSGCTNSIDYELKIGGDINSVLIDGNLNVTGNISSGNGFTGSCINTTFLNGIATECND